MGKIIYTYYDPSDRKSWLELRNKFTGEGTLDKFQVGGSDIATILNKNKYQSDIEFFHRAIGLRPKANSNNIYTYRGIVQERYIHDAYWRHFDITNPTEQGFIDNVFGECKTYRKAISRNAIVENTDFKGLFINFDFIICKNPYTPTGPLEIKSMKGKDMDIWDAKIGAPINPAYIYQINTQMFVGGFEYGELFILRDSEKPVAFTFEPNFTIMEEVLTGYHQMKQRVLQGREIMFSDLDHDTKIQHISEIEPEVKGTPAWEAYLKEEHKTENQKAKLDGNNELLAIVIEYLELTEKQNEMAPAILLAENKIRKEFIDKQCQSFEFQGLGHISWKSKFTVPATLLKKYRDTQMSYRDV